MRSGVRIREVRPGPVAGFYLQGPLYLFGAPLWRGLARAGRLSRLEEEALDPGGREQDQHPRRIYAGVPEAVQRARGDDDEVARPRGEGPLPVEHLELPGEDVVRFVLSGVRVRRRQISAYVLTGACVGLAACVLIGSGGLVQQNVGSGLELQVIAAVVIGGTSIIGGRGTVLGTLLGALLVGTVTSAVTLLSWPSELTQLFIGLFILVAVGVDLLRERRRSAR